jgi:hypothetical protein
VYRKASSGRPSVVIRCTIAAQVLTGRSTAWAVALWVTVSERSSVFWNSNVMGYCIGRCEGFLWQVVREHFVVFDEHDVALA